MVEVVDAAGEGAHHAFHLEFEEHGGEAREGHARLCGEHVHLQVVVLLQRVDHGLLVGREVGEELPFDALLVGRSEDGVVLPSHLPHEVVGTGYEHGAVIVYQVVAALRIGVAHPSWEGEHIAAVAA